jgi:cobalt/nickel transport system permease protein
MWVTTLAILGYAIKKTNKKLGERQIPLMGMLAAFIFAGQMLNIPIGGGTSGHMLGGVLAAVFLGPLAATIVMSTVFIVQCLLFQDGGLTTLGANIFNMGLIGTILGYYIYCGIRKISKNEKGMTIAAGIAGWSAVVFGSIVCSIELAASGTIPLEVVLPAMTLTHILVGIIEAGITMAVIGLVLKSRPDLLKLPKI